MYFCWGIHCKLVYGITKEGNLKNEGKNIENNVMIETVF